MKLEEYEIKRTVQRVQFAKENQWEVIEWLKSMELDVTEVIGRFVNPGFILRVSNFSLQKKSVRPLTDYLMFVSYGDYIYLNETGAPYASTNGWEAE